MQERLSLTDRIKVAITGKAYIPSLAQIDGADSVPLATFNTKPEQLRTNIGWVYAANSAIVDDVAAATLKLYRLKKDGDREEIDEHPILELLENPTLAHTGEQMRSLFHTYRNLVGEAYLLMVKAGNPVEVKPGVLPDALQVVPAHLVDFKLGEGRYSESKIKYGREEYKITEVIRDFMPDPGSPYYGRSIVAAASAAIDTDQQMQSWNRRVFQNNARPGLVFNLTGDHIDQTVRERLKQQMDEIYSGDGTFRSLVLENGDVKPYMLTQQDLDFLASREFTREEIMAMFKVPAAMLGMSKDYNRANIDGSRYIHMISNVVPRLRAEVRMWNTQLVKKYDATLELDFDSPVPEDVEAKLKQSQAGTNTWLTIDEVREQYGLEALPDKLGEQLYVPINSTPLARIAAGPKPAPATNPGNQAPTPSPDDGDDETAPEGKKSLPKPRS